MPDTPTAYPLENEGQNIVFCILGEIHPFPNEGIAMIKGGFHPKMKKTAAIKGRNIIGENVRRLRMNGPQKVTLEDMAARLALRGVQLDRSAIGRIENNDRYVLDYEAVALADALGVELAALFKPLEFLKSPFSKRSRK